MDKIRGIINDEEKNYYYFSYIINDTTICSYKCSKSLKLLMVLLREEYITIEMH